MHRCLFPALSISTDAGPDAFGCCLTYPPDVGSSRSSASALCSTPYHILDVQSLLLESLDLSFLCSISESLSDATVVLFVSIRHIIVPGRLAIDRLSSAKLAPVIDSNGFTATRMTGILDDGDGNRR